MRPGALEFDLRAQFHHAVRRQAEERARRTLVTGQDREELAQMQEMQKRAERKILYGNASKLLKITV